MTTRFAAGGPDGLTREFGGNCARNAAKIDRMSDGIWDKDNDGIGKCGAAMILEWGAE